MSRHSKSLRVTFKGKDNEDDVSTPRRSRFSSKPRYIVDNEDLSMKEDDKDEEYEEEEEEDLQMGQGDAEEEEEEEDLQMGQGDAEEEEEEDEEVGVGAEEDEEEGEHEGSETNEGSKLKNDPSIKLSDSHRLMKPIPTRGRPPKRRFGRSASPDLSKAGVGFTTSIPSNSKRPRLPYPVDDQGSPLPVVNDEYTLPDDSEGEEKITKDGDLLGGRQFLVRTFTLTGRGQTKYMLSTEPARAVGFRDSYLFFQYHPNLYKLVISQEDRNDLIDRGVIPYSYRSRAIALVTARSVYKEFGAKIVVDGKNITDDYYAAKLRTEGRVVEGTYAREPLAKVPGRSVDGLDFSMSNVNPARIAVEFFDKKNHNIAPGSNISATNWLYQHAAACSRFNSDLFYDRERVLLIENLGLRDSYTNTLHLPQSTQSTKVLDFRKVTAKTDDIVYSTYIRDNDVARRKTGPCGCSIRVVRRHCQRRGKKCYYTTARV
ncbi:Npl6p Ecym_7401 [Eremothecium cymbalariae DBVPG|uniref:Chromatin structure-remodeling complex subunit RSC7 n=1 Tax=Eremothecium cymbalariae (strain CBS 270.75 / DBVPG 7215 / KCTC 17166 / NRRL Y-17582) TaxID=931890 RepID=G8JWL2_ERECY|nr:hypothetical protein Ecym_7401 [Eremothecium cymbalariae DBVPG\